MARKPDLIRVGMGAVAALGITASVNVLIDFGAMIHDVVCSSHGWFA